MITCKHELSLKKAVLICTAWLSLLAALFPGAVLAEESPEPKKILVIHSYHQGCIWTDNIMAGIRHVIQKEAPNAELYVEYLDTLRYAPRVVFTPLEELYRSKYEDLDLDAIIAVDEVALNFLLARRHRLFSKVPVIFCGINEFNPSQIREFVNVTGVIAYYDLEGTISLALKLHPRTRLVVAVTDYSSLANATSKRFWEIFPKYENRVHFQRLACHNAEEMREALARVPRNAVLINMAFNYDKIGGIMSAREVFKMVRENTDAPLYTLWDDSIGIGAVGGMVTSGVQQGEEAAQLAVGILSGTPASDIPLVTKVSILPMFDYTELRRFKIREKSLPPDSIIINKPRSFYLKYKKAILIISAMVLPLGVMVVFLAITNLSRQKALVALEQSESRYRAIVEDQTDFVLRFTPHKTITFANRAMLSLLGLPLSDVVGKPLDRIMSKGRLKVAKQRCSMLTKLSPFFEEEELFTPPEEKQRIIMWKCLAIFTEQGKLKEYQAVGNDITAQKLAQRAFRHSQEQFRLLAMYQQEMLEEERATISREIHDELGQNLTALKMGINVLGHLLKDLPTNARSKLKSLTSMVQETIGFVKHLSQNLRPAELDNLGLEAAMHWHSQDFLEHTGIKVEYEYNCDLELRIEQTIALYRVYQEALTNVARHSQADTVRIHLTCNDSFVLLEVWDNGRGISREAAASSNSFGLIGMRERMRHLGGDVNISAAEEGGTMITASIPVKYEPRKTPCASLL